MKIAVIGANGFIGRNVAKHFANTILITRKTMDISNNCQVETFFKSHPVDWIIHCAIEGGSRLKKDDKDVTYNNLKTYYSFSRLGIPMVYFSSGASIWMPDTPYGFSKKIIEEMNHPHVKIIRIFGCYGPFEKETRFTYAVFKLGYVSITNDRYFDFIHVKDLMYIIENTMKDKNINGIIDAVYPGKKITLSQFAHKHGAKYEIQNDKMEQPYISIKDGNHIH